MGLADKAIAGAIRAVVGAVGSAEKKAAGYVGSKVLASRASKDASRYTTNSFMGKFSKNEADAVKDYGVGSVVPRRYMAPHDLKFVPNKDGEKVYLAGRDITDHWNSGNFKPAHFGEYMPEGMSKAKYGPWWSGDLLSTDMPSPGMRVSQFMRNPFGDASKGGMQYLHRPTPFSPEEVQMGREWIAGTGATGAAFWGAISQMRKPNFQRQQVQPATDAEQRR